MLQSGKQSCALWQLDAAVSENGRIDLEFLSKNGYSIGVRARKRLREPDIKPDQGGARRKFDDAELLACAQEVLAKHSKAGSKVVRAQKTDQGWRKVRRQGSGAETVPSESLLAAPGTIHSAEPALQQQMSVVTLGKWCANISGTTDLVPEKRTCVATAQLSTPKLCLLSSAC